VDVASFALRLALRTMRRPKSRATIILDEPFKFVSKDLQPRVADMLRDLSDRLRVQFIIVTHEETLVDAANKVFRVRKNGPMSKVIVEA
jgi:DNA repair exonuclease SbcCD ATPase subunit